MKRLSTSFFSCQHAKIIWHIVHIATGLTPPKSISHMLGHWLPGINNKDRLLIFVEATALIWAIWCTRNDLIFEKTQITSVMHVIFRGAYWLRFWSLL